MWSLRCLLKVFGPTSTYDKSLVKSKQKFVCLCIIITIIIIAFVTIIIIIIFY